VISGILGVTMDETTPTSRDSAPATPASALPSFESCWAAVSAGAQSGIDALGALPAPLQQCCPELAGILRSSAVRTSLEIYTRQDAEAVRQQASLMQEATRADVCLMAAGVTSGLVLAVAAVLPSGPEYVTPLGTINITLGLGIVTLALGAAGTFFGYLARDQGRISRWQARRGEAEIARLDVFTTIAGKAAEAGPAVDLHGLALVVRHLLDDQRNWLGARALRHRKSSEATSRWGGLANALTFIGGSGAIIASQAKGSIWIVLSGLIGAAIAAYAANRDALRRDRANADRYEKAQVALDGLSGRTDDVAARIAAGEPKALVAFTDAVTDLLATEHKQWLEGTAQAEASLGKLDAQLRQLTDTKK
jgi:hypothetical protein